MQGVLPQDRLECGDGQPETPPEQKRADQNNASSHDRVEPFGRLVFRSVRLQGSLVRGVIGSVSAVPSRVAPHQLLPAPWSLPLATYSVNAMAARCVGSGHGPKVQHAVST